MAESRCVRYEALCDPAHKLQTHVPLAHRRGGMDVVSVLGRPRPQGPVGSTTVWRCPYRETLDLLWGTLYGAPVSLGGLAEAHAWVVEQVRAGALPPCADLEDDP